MAAALPSAVPQCPPAYSIGCQVTLQTQNGAVQGEVFAFDIAAGVIALQQPGSTPFHHHLRLIKEDVVQSATHDAAPSAVIDPAHLPVVDEQRSREREERAVRAAQLEAAKIGVGVTSEAQKVFDALAKTLPCRWDDKTIVVLEEIYISEPYGTENCKSIHPDDVAAMERVQKVLLAERNLLFGGA